MKDILSRISGLVNDSADSMLEQLKRQIAIPSVQGEASEGAPFGKAVAQSLDAILALAAEMGFKTANHEGYVGTVDWGEGEELLGVLSHVDVVPPGDLSSWNTPPFEMTFKDGFLYGRGVADDKGPLISALYGAYALKQTGFVPQKRIRFIIGTNEESGWGCIHYYKEHLEPPHSGFSPDGMFTVVNREKGILTVDYERPVFAEGITVEGGEASNLVPAECRAVLSCNMETVLKALALCADEGVSYTAEACANAVKITCKGKSAHAMSPEKGKNAVLGMLKALSACDGAGAELSLAAKDLVRLLDKSTNGGALGIACRDEVSGELTVNLGKLTLTGGMLRLTFDIRTPVTLDLDFIEASMDKAMLDIRFHKAGRRLKYPLYVPADTSLIKTLCDVYQTVTDREAVLYSIGGGTYARAFPNCVCFGAVYPDEELTVHSPNERALEKNVINNAKIYGLAIQQLTK